MKGIIVGVDESAYAQVALKWAVQYGSDRGLPVTALMAWDYIQQQHTDPDAHFDPKYNAEAAAKVLDELVSRALGTNGSVAKVVVCDRAGHALIDAAGTDASLVVVGARGMSGFRGLMLGSVSRYVVHAAAGPVAVIRTQAAYADAPVVVGLDGSESSRRALEWAVAYARSRNLPLTALHAWIPPYNPLGLWSPRDLEKQAHAAARLVNDELANIDEMGLVAPIDRRVREERASAALLEAGCLASIVVIGSRGHGQLSSTLLGSVSDQVSHYATCPVAVIP